eukprot:TRINITY_DN78658_c0_g1_i1.p1 TRINITY_DN78658_c0_g1~~TRINITY_DN78658_c0_g1_i1.p1  ORF type:complete len:138 (+),score=26.36 TRINITY_DN78658_c0_g1_i1:130-543(+)
MVSLRHVCAAFLSVSLVEASMECSGGANAVCECLMGCKVFGGNADGCSQGNSNILVEHSVRAAMQSSNGNEECEGMKCVIKCAQSLDCLDTDIRGRCSSVKQYNKECKVDCSGAHGVSMSGLASAALLLLAVMKTGH